MPTCALLVGVGDPQHGFFAEGFPQRLLESLLVEGLLAIPVADDAHGGFARLARLLRAAAVGSGPRTPIARMPRCR